MFTRTIKKGSDFDLEKYFKQQAALAEQKRKLKKVSKASSDKDQPVPAKKAKVPNSDGRSSRNVIKSSTHVEESIKTNIPQCTKEVDSSSVTNEPTDKSSGSEYIPSDNEIDSGI